MAKRINVTYFSNINVDFDEYKDFYRETYELTEEDNVNDSDVYQFMEDWLSDAYNDFMDNLSYNKECDKPCVIIGTLGLWNGNKDIVPVPMDNIKMAIEKCIGSHDYVEIKQVCGHLEVGVIHHDGRNNFEIHLLNEKGCRAKNNYESSANLENRCYHKAIKGYLV